jgi:ATP-dependent DNA helicase RecG
MLRRAHPLLKWHDPRASPRFSQCASPNSGNDFRPRDFEGMDRNDRIRACHQHCALKFVMREYMTNQSLRERFHLPENKSANVSQVIAATIDEKLIRLDETIGGSRKYARYLPFWA